MFISEPSCFLPHRDSVGNNLEHNISVISAEECQDMCKSNPLCHYFTLNERNEGENGCYLKSKVAIGSITARRSVTLGPKICPTKGNARIF